MTTLKRPMPDICVNQVPKTLQLREIERKEGENRFSVVLAQKRTRPIPQKIAKIHPSWIHKKSLLFKLKILQKPEILTEACLPSKTETLAMEVTEVPPEWHCSSSYIPPNIQYFLASLCDTTWASGSNQLMKTRCPYAVEVIALMESLENQKTVSPTGYGASVNLTVIKEILKRFQGEILISSLESLLKEVNKTATIPSLLRSLHRCTKSLPEGSRDFLYLICRALRTLVSQCDGVKVESYTELLLNFTPIFFPQTMGDLDAFLKASRLLLTLVDHCELIFDGFDNPKTVDINGNTPTLEDDTFFTEILSCLEQLEIRLESDNSASEENINSQLISENLSDENGNFGPSPMKSSATQNFYHLTYVEV